VKGDGALIVEREEGESQERLLSRFRQMVQRSGVLREVKRRRRFVSKSEARRIAHAKARRRARRKAERAPRTERRGG
jgi:small subunit ribosomal protein S21